ncbi:MAG: ABC transporter ATP-binding protein [Nitrososphaerota archaeon]|nr:ABC transporter ATP-binding protein [Nitrososphaerota archaeon]
MEEKKYPNRLLCYTGYRNKEQQRKNKSQEADTMIRIKNLKKSYGSKRVLKGVDLNIEKGSFTALVGRNGSGKSTLVDILCKAKQASGGTVKYGFNENKIFDHIGVQLQDANFDHRLKVKEIINMWKSIYGSPKADLDELIEILELDQIMNHRSNRISGGQRQKLSILLALFHDPEFLIFDELTTGLDATARDDVQEYLKMINKKQGKTILIVSHYMDEVEALCDKAYFLKDGVIFESGSPSEIKEKYNCESLQTFVKKHMGKVVA